MRRDVRRASSPTYSSTISSGSGRIGTPRSRSRPRSPGSSNAEKPLGDALRGRIAAILSAGDPALGQDEAAAAAIIVNQVMKIIPALASTDDESAAALVGEARKLLALYIDEILRR